MLWTIRPHERQHVAPPRQKENKAAPRQNQSGNKFPHSKGYKSLSLTDFSPPLASALNKGR